jgi:hypothetical protein
MKISKTHQVFSVYLKEPRALTNPEDYLGPNWQDVINFWFYLDGLSEDEKERILDSYWALDEDVRVSAWNDAKDAAKKVVGKKVRDAACDAAYDVTEWCDFVYVTLELLGHHKILEHGKSLTFLPLCLEP